MDKVLVAVIDSTKARFLNLEPAEFPEEMRGARFVELDSLLSPLNEAQDLWSSTKTGRNVGASVQQHSYDDHREKHLIEFERRFTQAIATHIMHLVHSGDIQQLILVAEPQVVGLLREALATSVPPKLQVNELPKNLSHLKPLEIHKFLANQGLVSEPVRNSDISLT